MRFACAIGASILLAGCSVPGGTGEASDVATGTLLVANKRDDSLSRIDLASGAETGRVDTCANPHELAASPDRLHVALACYGGASLEIFDIATLARVASITLGEGARPHGLVWHPNGLLVATAEGRGSIFTVADPLGSAPRLTEIGSGGEGPHMVVLDASGTQAWGTVIHGSTVVRYDLATGEEAARRTLPGETEGLALTADGQALWVGTNAENRLYRLDPETLEVTAEVPAGDVPIRVVAHPSQQVVVAGNYGDGTANVVDSTNAGLLRSIDVSGSGEAEQVTLAFSSDGARLYAAETANDTVAEIDFATGEVLRRLPTRAGGDGMAVVD